MNKGEYMKMIREDFSDRLDNLAAIKGSKYADFVYVAVTSSLLHRNVLVLSDPSLTKLISHLVQQSTEDIFQVLNGYCQLNASEIMDAVNDAESIVESLKTNIERI